LDCIAASVHDVLAKYQPFVGTCSNAVDFERCRKAYAQGDNDGAKGALGKSCQRMLERTGDEGRAIREANAVVARQAEDG
jgi:hypothetical protein